MFAGTNSTDSRDEERDCMVEKELKNLIQQIQTRGCEEQTTEVKSAHGGCPEKLYDTISSFSNQNSGGVFVFGLDERIGFAKVGVYDAQDLQKKVMEYCEQMTPVVRPVFTVYNEDGMNFVSAEIPPIDITERPCFKTARGRLQGSYIRVGDADKPMTEYEVYSYEAYRRKYRDDIREAEEVSVESLDMTKIEAYLALKRSERPNLAALSKEQQYEMTGIMRGGKFTLMAVLLFGLYPQAFYPQLSIIATVVPGREMGTLDTAGNRFWDSKRIEGTVPDMLDGALSFVRTNMRISTGVNPDTGERIDRPQYPITAVREAVLNALVHRDYSFHTEGMPIQLIMYSDRMEIINPGGLYGRLTIDQLGQMQPDTRNPALVTAMETLGQTENRYSGIPTIRYAMRKHALLEPVFADTRGTFKVVLYNEAADKSEQKLADMQDEKSKPKDEKDLLTFCSIPRSREEIISYIKIASGQYALRRYLDPLVRAGAIRMTNPSAPRSRDQKYVTVK